VAAEAPLQLLAGVVVDAAALQPADSAELRHRRQAHQLRPHQPHRFLLFLRPRLLKHRMPMQLRPPEVVVLDAVELRQPADSAVVVAVAGAVAQLRLHPLQVQQ
jgi:hypothetical protein